MREVKLEVVQTFYDNGQIRSEAFRLNDEWASVFHNENGAAYREWDEDGRIIHEQYRIHGQLHNVNGPASRTWDETGKVFSEQHWIMGKRVSPAFVEGCQWMANNMKSA